jgi:hypothetical protein
VKFLKAIPLYTFLLAVFFCLHGSLENFGFISFKEAIQVFFYSFISIAIAFFVINFISKSILYSGFITFFLAVIYLFFAVIKTNVFQITFLGKYVIFLPLLSIVVLLVIILFRKKDKFLSKATLFLNVLLISYCILDTIFIIQKEVNKPKKTYSNTIRFNAKRVKDRPNVYFLLFDEYAGFKSLKDSFGFENNFFYEQLQNDSFKILNTFSNYNSTPFSMASLFNMDYLKAVKDSSTVGWRETQERMQDIKYGEVFGIFKSLGYTVKSFSMFEAGDNKSVGGNQFLLGHKRVLTHKMFHNVLLRDIGFNFVSGKNANTFIQKIFLGDMPYYNGRVEDGLFSSLNTNPTPQFVYAHFLMPHFPFLYDSIGNKVPNDLLFEERSWLIKAQYVSYLKYCNKKIIEYEQNIIKKDSNAVIVIMSDHGFRFENLTASAFNNFCAIRTRHEHLTDYGVITSNVNFFRYLLNTNFNQAIPYLNDKMVQLKEE